MITRRTPLKRSALKRKPTKKRKGQDEAYLTWIRTQRCRICADWQTEACHVGVRGRGQKCPDREAIPLCAFHHRHATTPGGGPWSHHSLGKKFWVTHGLDREEVIST